MKYIIFALFYLSTIQLSAQRDFIKPDSSKYRIRTYMSLTNRASYLDSSGSSITRYQKKIPEYDEPIDYTLNYTIFTIGVKGEYYITPDFHLDVDVPFSFHTLQETEEHYRIVDSTRYDFDYEPPAYTLYQFDYFAFALNYDLLQTDYIWNRYRIEARIPPGFHKGQFDDPDYDFLSDGAFEMYFQTGIGIITKSTQISTYFAYNIRDEEFSDRIISSTELSFSTVEATRIFLRANFFHSLDKDNDRPFHPLERPIHGDFFELQPGIIIDFGRIAMEADYRVRLFGKNTWESGCFTLLGKVKFN